MHLTDPVLPPLLTGHAIDAPLDVLGEAIRRAVSGELGAGDVVWARDAARAALAIILEPEVPLERALQMGPLLTVAVEDALAQLCPPKVAIQHRWPDVILLNNSAAGAVRLAAPRVKRGPPPAWLVAAAVLDIAAVEERSDWSRTALAEEVGEEITRTDLIEAISAHFLKRLDAWGDEGFRSLHDQWLFRAAGRETPLAFTSAGRSLEGLVIGLDEAGNLMLRSSEDRVLSLPYLPHVTFFEPAANAP